MWEVALPGISPLRCPRGILALQTPFRGSPVATTLSQSLGPLAYSGRLVRCPGCPLLDTHLSTTTLPAGPWTPAPPPNGFHAFIHHQQQNDLLLVNLTNPLTNITLTPGSLGWDSILPSLSHSHNTYHIRSTHSGPLTHTHSSKNFNFSIHHC